MLYSVLTKIPDTSLLPEFWREKPGRKLWKLVVYLLSLFVCISLSAIANHTWAQVASMNDNWYRGSVVLAEGDSLSGDLHYDLQNNLVQINTNNGLKAFSARQIWSFSFYDPDRMTDRQFYALPYNVESNYKTPVLFELITEGDISLLAREKLVVENIPQYGYGRYGSYYYTRTRLSRDFYFGYANGTIKRYSGLKKDLYFLLKDKSSEVKKFVNENRLRYDDTRDLIQIINYYNSLKR